MAADQDGKLLGSDAVKFFERSGLPRDQLAKVSASARLRKDSSVPYAKLCSFNHANDTGLGSVRQRSSRLPGPADVWKGECECSRAPCARLSPTANLRPLEDALAPDSSAIQSTQILALWSLHGGKQALDLMTSSPEHAETKGETVSDWPARAYDEQQLQRLLGLRVSAWC